MLRSTFVVALTIALGGGARAGSLPDETLVADGSARLEAGDVDGALAAFARAEKLAPKDPRPRYLRGAALARKKDVAGAIAGYRAALALDPKLAAVHNELGALLADSGRPDEARASFNAAVAADPSLGEAWYNLAKLDPAGADQLADFRRAARLLPRDADVRIDLSVALRRAGRLDEAVASAREAVSLAAGNEAAHLNLGFALQGAKKLDDAAAEFTAATRLADGDATAWWGLGLVESERHRLDAAVAALEHAARLKPQPAIVADLAGAYQAKGAPARAESTLREAIARHPRSLALRIRLASVLAGESKCADARSELRRLPRDKAVAAVEDEVRGRCPDEAKK